MGYNVDDKEFQGGAGDFSLHSIQTSAEAHITSCEMDNWDCVLGGKATEA
jgi:hypothetical protein